MVNRVLDVGSARRKLNPVTRRDLNAVGARRRELFNKIVHRDFDTFVDGWNVAADLDFGGELIPKVQPDVALRDVKILAGGEPDVAGVVELSAGDLITVKDLPDGLREHPPDDAADDLQ